MTRLIPLALTLLILCTTAQAQAPLPPAAAAALEAAQAAAAEAMVTYDRYLPDQPLWREAFAAAEKAHELAPQRPEPLRFLAQAYGLTGWTGRAWTAWQDYAAAGGTMDAAARTAAAGAAGTLGFQAMRAGNLPRALELLTAANGYAPADLDVASWLGQALLASGDAAAATPYLAAAIVAQPQLEPLLERAQLGSNYGLANADSFIAGRKAYAAGDYQAALREFRRAAESAPTFVDAARGVAAALGALGQEDAALTAWEHVLQLAPGDAEAAEVIARHEAQRAAAEAAAPAQAAEPTAPLEPTAQAPTAT
ncbi:MAG: hypothetical protein H3C53_02015, partial [Trueperaceae bacterium]|nr:hypothetical protein [Trueperaceae bacterium]